MRGPIRELINSAIKGIGTDIKVGTNESLPTDGGAA